MTIVRSDESWFMIDCGKPYRWTIKRLNHNLPEAILITHEHNDHAHAAKNFLERGVEMYMTAGTAKALELERHNLHIIEEGVKFKLAGVTIKPIESEHDAWEPVNFILEDSHDRVLYVTDTGTTPDVRGDFTKIYIEANHSAPELWTSKMIWPLQKRIFENHLAIEQTTAFVARYPRAEVTLIHVSAQNGEKFFEQVRRIENGRAKLENVFGNVEAENCGGARQERDGLCVYAGKHLHEQSATAEL